MNDNTFQIKGTVIETLPSEKYSKIILRYLNGSREVETPFVAATGTVNSTFQKLRKGDKVRVFFEVGGTKNSKGQYYSNNWVTKVID